MSQAGQPALTGNRIGGTLIFPMADLGAVQWVLAVGLSVCAVACGSTTDEPADTTETAVGDKDGSEDPKPAPTSKSSVDLPKSGTCGIHSDYAGDDVCIPPPDPSRGVQIHTGPTDYDDPDDVDQFLLGPGDETTECWYTKAPNDEDISYYGAQYRMRPGSHHLILKRSEAAKADGWHPCPDGLTGAFGGTQKSVEDFPKNGELAPEDAGFGRKLSGRLQIAAEMHYVNTTDEPLLRENWVNYLFKDEKDITTYLSGIALIGGMSMNVAPGEKKIVRQECESTVERRLVSLTGHSHAHSRRVSAWKISGKEESLVYESFDWSEPAKLDFNTVTKNPTPDPDSGRSGGHSGLLVFHPGDTLAWECEIDNDSDRSLHFANAVYTAEMCNLFGSTPTGWSCFR